MHRYKNEKITAEQDYIGTWKATTDNFDAEMIDGIWRSDCPIGEGLTEQDAVDDLIEKLKELEDE